MKSKGLKHPAPSCVLRLQAVLSTLKPVERRIAEQILQNPQDILSLTIMDLSRKTNASYASINRLINRIGLSGYKELKKLLYQDIISENIPEANAGSLDFLDIITFSQGASTETILANIYSQALKVMEESRSIISVATLEKAAQKILSAKNMCFVGTGLSGICAKYAYSRFFRIGIPCCYEEDSTLYRMRSALLKKGDLLFAISSSGRSSTILGCAETARANSADIISLTDYAVSPLSQLAEINLFTTPRNSSQFLKIDMPLVVGQILIIDTLYMVCCVKKGKKSSELFIKTKESADLEKLK